MSALTRLRPTPWAELSTPLKIRRVVAIVSQIGLLGMVASALTSESEVGLRADGSTRKEHAGSHRDELSVQGDPKVEAPKAKAPNVKAPNVEAQRDQAGEQQNSTGSGDTEAQGGNAADDSEKAASP